MSGARRRGSKCQTAERGRFAMDKNRGLEVIANFDFSAIYIFIFDKTAIFFKTVFHNVLDKFSRPTLHLYINITKSI